MHIPKLSLSELHPMEGKLTSGLTSELWSSLMDGEGRILDIEHLNQVDNFFIVSVRLRFKHLFLAHAFCFHSSPGI